MAPVSPPRTLSLSHRSPPSSPGMVEAAKTNQDRSKGEFFIAGDVSKLKKNLLENTNKTNIMPGAGFDCGLFDLSVAVFVFNYMNISSMSATFRDVFSLLKPGGHFVLSVPHPSMANHGTLLIALFM